MSHFNFVTRVNTDAVCQELAISAPLWDAFTARQSFPGSAHADTKCIPLRGAFCASHFTDPKATRERTPYANELPYTIALINRVIQQLNVDSVGNVMAVALQPGGVITPHYDGGEYADHFERFHIAVTSPYGNWFQCGDETVNPHRGDVFFFNHRLTHSAGNPSDKERVHLIVDVTLKD